MKKSILSAFLLFSVAFFTLVITTNASQATKRYSDDNAVDLELVIAVDISFSINEKEQKIQRQGYAAAFNDEQVVRAITSGLHGRVAVTYVEWADKNTQIQIIPWMIIDGSRTAKLFADKLEKSKIYSRGSTTSISAALIYAKKLFETNQYVGLRRVIDISGDGPNNTGIRVDKAREQVVKKGITINGLPLLIGKDDVNQSVDLTRYYEDCVVGGPSAFVMPLKTWTEFAKTIKHKLILEIANIKYFDQSILEPRLIKAALRPKTNCYIGEQIDRDNHQKQLDILTPNSERWRLRDDD